MELIKLNLSPMSGIFDNPLISFLPLFGFAKGLADALENVRSGKVKVNGNQVEEGYVLKRGDMVSFNDVWGIVVSDEDKL